MHLNVIEFGGTGPGILLLHGLTDRGATWARTARWLTSYGRVVAYDARGHGFSDKPDGPYDRAAYIGDAARVIEERDLGASLVIGHSMGGLTAWHLAAQRPELVRGIVIGDMTPTPAADIVAKWEAWLDGWPVPFQTLADARAFLGQEHQGEGDAITENLTPGPDGWRLTISREHVLETLKHWQGKDFRPELASVQCPALVVAGGRSNNPVDVQKEMSSLLPQGEFAILEDAGHVLHWDDPKGWRAVVERFVSQTPMRGEVR